MLACERTVNLRWPEPIYLLDGYIIESRFLDLEGKVTDLFDFGIEKGKM